MEANAAVMMKRIKRVNQASVVKSLRKNVVALRIRQNLVRLKTRVNNLIILLI